MATLIAAIGTLQSSPGPATCPADDQWPHLTCFQRITASHIMWRMPKNLPYLVIRNPKLPSQDICA